MMNRLIIKTFAVGSILIASAHAQSMQDGLRALDFEKFEGARHIFSSLTKTEPTNADNWYYLGQSYLNLYKADSAKWAYQEGIKIGANAPANYVGLGELLMAENKKEEAKTYFNKALSFSKTRDGLISDPKALQLVAAALVSTENKVTEDALVYIKNAVELAPKNYDVLVSAGDVYLELNNAGEAANHYEKAESIQPKNPKAFTRVAEIWLRVKNYETTLTDLNKALAIDSNYAPALKLMSELYYKSKKYEIAKYYYTKYLQNSEVSLANRQRFVRILFNAKEYENALNDLKEIILIPNHDVFMYRMIGYSYYEVAEIKKDATMYPLGVSALEKFIATVPSDKIIASDYEYLGKHYSRIAGKDSLAVAYINKAIETDPSKVDLNKDAGQILYRLKRFDQSIVFYERYIANAPKVSINDYFLLGMTAYFGKQYPKADSAFAKVIEMKPNYADGYYWRGNVQANLDTQAKDTIGFSSYNTYISMAESNVEKNKKNLIVAYNYVATYYILHDNNKEAKVYLQKVLALDPTNKQATTYLKEVDKK